jgi:hypothetical protein
MPNFAKLRTQSDSDGASARPERKQARGIAFRVGYIEGEVP